jgi:hypothetical protein
MIECEDEEVVYEDHSKISKKLSHSFSGSGRLFTLKPLSQKSQINSHGSHSSADCHDGTSHKKRNTNENFEKSVNNRIKRLEGSVQSLEGSVSKLVRMYQAITPIGYKQASASSVLLLTDTKKCNIGHMVQSKMF